MKRLFNFMAMLGLMVGLLAATDARSGEQPTDIRNIVLSIEGGTAIMGASGLNDIGPLKRHELATSWLVGASGGYQYRALGGLARVTLGVDYLGNTDGDWGYSESIGPYTATARQIVDIQSLGGVLAAEYDFEQIGLFGIHPFIGGGLRLQHNRAKQQTIDLNVARGGDVLGVGCRFDNNSNTAFGWHAAAGLTKSWENWSLKVFYQRTDRGDIETGGNGTCRLYYNDRTLASKAVYARKRKIDLVSDEIRARVSYAF